MSNATTGYANMPPWMMRQMYADEPYIAALFADDNVPTASELYHEGAKRDVSRAEFDALKRRVSAFEEEKDKCILTGPSVIAEYKKLTGV